MLGLKLNHVSKREHWYLAKADIGYKNTVSADDLAPS